MMCVSFRKHYAPTDIIWMFLHGHRRVFSCSEVIPLDEKHDVPSCNLRGEFLLNIKPLFCGKLDGTRFFFNRRRSNAGMHAG